MGKTFLDLHNVFVDAEEIEAISCETDDVGMRINLVHLKSGKSFLLDNFSSPNCREYALEILEKIPGYKQLI